MKYNVYKVQTITTTYEDIEAPDSLTALELVQSGKAEETDYENDTNYETKELEE